MLGPSLVVQTDMLFIARRCESDLTLYVQYWCDEHQYHTDWLPSFSLKSKPAAISKNASGVNAAQSLAASDIVQAPVLSSAKLVTSQSSDTVLCRSAQCRSARSAQYVAAQYAAKGPHFCGYCG